MTVALSPRLGFECDAIDVFCGFGGSSKGMHDAGATVRAAANHKPLSIECHSRNFPDTDHWLADLVDADAKNYVDPVDLPRARFAWFSPACTHHSQANAKKVYEQGRQLALMEDEDWDQQEFVNSERSRVTMSCVLRYTARHRPEILIVENVLEVTKWGPGRDGSTFRWWMTELVNLGYEVKPVFLNSMFFPPCPQSRDRIYIVAWRKGNTVPDLDYRPTAYCTSDSCGGRIVEAVQTWKRRTRAWMLETWGKYGTQYDYRCPDCRAVVHPASWMALSAIDWSTLGPTLEERIARGKRPADSTWERIRRAVQKYRNAPPVILVDGPVTAAQVHVAHGSTVSTSNTGSAERYASNRSRTAAEPIPTLARRNTIGLALEGGVVPLSNGSQPVAASRPMPALLERSKLALALTVKNNGSIDEAGYRGHHAADPLGTIAASGRPQSVLALVVPNRTHGNARHSGAEIPTAATSATLGLVFAGAGNIYEAADYSRARSVGDVLPTQQTTATSAIVTALFSKINGGPGDTAWHGVDEELRTITSRDTTGLVVVPWIDHWISEPVAVTEQLATITARMRHTLASLEPSDEPITDELLMQVRFRMLEPDPELRRAMAFDDGYVLLGNKTQMTAGLGDAVTPPVASWLTGRCLATLGGSQ